MLSPEVVQAVKDKKFHIYAVGHIDEAMEILTGKPFSAGKNKKDTISDRISTRLDEYFKTRQKLKA